MLVKRKALLIAILLLTQAVIAVTAAAQSAPPDTILYLPFDGSTLDQGPLRIENRAGGTFNYGPGIRGEAAFFDGENNFLKFPDRTELRLSKQFTISFWFKLERPLDIKKYQMLHILRFETDSVRWSSALSLAFEEDGLDARFTHRTGEISFTGGATGTDDLEFDPAVWYHFILTHKSGQTSLLLLDEKNVPLSYRNNPFLPDPNFEQMGFYLGGVDRHGLPEQLLDRILSYRGYLDEFIVLAEPVDVPDLFRQAFNKASDEKIAPFLERQTYDLINYPLFGLNDYVDPLTYLDLLLSRDRLNPALFLERWKSLKRLKKEEEYRPLIEKEIDFVLQQCPASEYNLTVALQGCRLLGREKQIIQLEDRIAAEFPESAIARKRRILAKNPLLKIVDPDPWIAPRDTLYPDVVIGQSIMDTPEEELDPNYVLMGIYGIAVNSQGNIFVASRQTFQISSFDENGLFLQSYGPSSEMRQCLSCLRAMRFNERGNLMGVSSRVDTIMYWTLSLPEGTFTLLGRGESKQPFYDPIPYSRDHWAAARFMTKVYDYQKDIKGEALRDYRTDDKVITLFDITAKKGSLDIKSLGSLGNELTDGGTLEGRFDHFTLCTLNDVSYDFDGQGNVYLAHRFLPRFRKVSSAGKLLFDYEFDFFRDMKITPMMGLGNGYRLNSCFSAVRSTNEGKCILLMHNRIFFTDTTGKVIKSCLLANPQDSKNPHLSLDVGYSYGDKMMFMTRDGSKLYAVSGGNKIYVFNPTW